MGNRKSNRSGGGPGKHGIPWSQSGGIASTFAGHGGVAGGYSPGGTAERKIGKTVRGNGTRINIRTPSGDLGKTRLRGSYKHGTGLERTGAASRAIVRTYRKSARGRGGSSDS